MNTVFEAFDHMVADMKARGERFGKDLHEAKQCRAGMRGYPFSEARAAKLLMKYGRGRYKVETRVTYAGQNSSLNA